MEGGLVVIDDFNVMGFVSVPGKTNPPLQVDAYAELSLPIAPQGLEMIAGVSHQILQAGGGVQNVEPAQRLHVNRLETANVVALPEGPGVLAAKRSNHAKS
jgi:hypothetical protein